MKVKSGDFPEGSAMRAQLEAVESEARTKTDERLSGGTKKRGHPEDDLQKELIRMAESWPMQAVVDMQHWPANTSAGSELRKWPALSQWLFHIPNGGARTATEGGIFKAMGVAAGVWDLLLMLPVCYPSGKVSSGLWMECKAGTGRLTKSQVEFRERAYAMNYECEEIRTPVEFQRAVIAYATNARPISSVNSLCSR